MTQAQWLTAANLQHSVDQLISLVNANVKCLLLYKPVILQSKSWGFFLSALLWCN